MSFRSDGVAALEWVERYLETSREQPVLAQVEPGEIRSRLPASAPEEPEPFGAVLRDLETVLMPGVTHWQSPRFFAYFATTGSEPAILAELLAAGLNQIGILWRTSPALQELEEVTLSWLAELLGLPSGWHGHIEDTASTGTVTALAAARAAKPGSRVVVCSEHAHSAAAKAARLLELELRTVPGDDRYAMRPAALDLEGACAVVATIGTTSSTAIDPIPAIADRCAAEGIWLHVDAAYAGSAAVCPELRPLFAGWERADSLVVNPHKWLFTPLDCSAFWSRRPEDLRRAFSLVPEFLRVNEDVVSLSEYSLPLGRRFRALKLWAVLRCYGRSGLQERIREAIRLAALLESWVRDEPGWELCAPRPFSLVCFRLAGSDETNEGCSSGSTPRARSFSPTRGSTAATSSGSRSATRARPRTTSGSPGTSSAAKRLRSPMRERAVQRADGEAIWSATLARRMSVLIRVEDEPPRRRLDYFRHVVADTFVPFDLQIDADHDLRAQILTGQVGPVQVSKVTAPPLKAFRTAKLIRVSDPEFFKLEVPVRGRTVFAQGEREAALEPGDFTLLDLSRPCQLVDRGEGHGNVAVKFPHAALPLHHDELAQLTAVPISGRDGLGAAISPLARHMARHLDDRDPTEGARLAAALIDLLVVALAERLDRSAAVAPATRRRALLASVQAFIDERLADPGLSPSAIAAAHHISLRYLYKLFETQQTSVAGWIRDRRLERCRRDLADPTLDNWSVSAIALRWGLTDPAHFSRAFRAAYGLPPTRYRRTANTTTSR